LYQLLIRPRAAKMTIDAYHWYEEQQTGRGWLFLHALDSFYEKLLITPNAYSKVKRNYRQTKLPGYPYLIIFEVQHTTVTVYSVFHTSRNPKEKFKKEAK
jgi:hypothetical protein